MKNKAAPNGSQGRQGKILAIDFGTRNVGLAVTDDGRHMVFGRGVIRDFKSLEHLFEQLEAICKEESVSLIVFGLPYGESEEEIKAVERYKSIAERLEKYLKTVPVEFSDESFSTFDGLSGDFGLEEAELDALRKNLRSHERAAMIILKRYLAVLGD